MMAVFVGGLVLVVAVWLCYVRLGGLGYKQCANVVKILAPMIVETLP